MNSILDKLSGLPAAQKAALLVMLLAGVGAAWYFTTYDDTRTQIAAAKGQTKQLTKTLAEEQEVERNLATYRAEIEALRAERDRMRDRLPDNAEIADLLEKIHGQAKITGLEISRFQRLPTEVESMYARIPVKMELLGSFPQITSFFYQLGRLTRIVNVEDIKLVSKATDQASREKHNLLLATCTATTFMYVADTAVAEAAPAAAAPKGKK